MKSMEQGLRYRRGHFETPMYVEQGFQKKRFPEMTRKQ